MSQLLCVKDLKKKFAERNVIQGINFSLEKGETLCFLGPNGAGKSTTINILTGALKHDAGSIHYRGEFFEKNIRSYKQALGVVPQNIALYEDLTAAQNIRFFASLYGIKGKSLARCTDKALFFAGLQERSGDKVRNFSGGMKRRLNIACAIAHQPEILIMDEPTVGVDPQSRNHILEGVKKMRSEGMTVLYTTHYMEEVEEIATRIIIMDQGQIIAEGTAESLKNQLNQDREYIIEVDKPEKVNTDIFYRVEGVRHVEMSQEKLLITSLLGVENLDRLIACLMNNGIRIHHIAVQSNNLETVFLNLTGRRLRD
ncbi:MAG: ABC transporter ATP-binding protein [Tindallia sp. MSAO_Bac2]|nr:MAG: ABC transporter ATP-binding protein [Tindallia sp. MSAO_Bac2]